MKGLLYSLGRVFRKNKEVFYVVGGLSILGAILLGRRRTLSAKGESVNFSSKGDAEIIDTIPSSAAAEDRERDKTGRKGKEVKGARPSFGLKEDKGGKRETPSKKIKEGSMDSRIEDFIDGEKVSAESMPADVSGDSKGRNVKLGQCKAITKKGTRCRNKAVDISGYCLRHKQAIVAE